jgi:hypothetical protein
MSLLKKMSSTVPVSITMQTPGLIGVPVLDQYDTAGSAPHLGEKSRNAR